MDEQNFREVFPRFRRDEECILEGSVLFKCQELTRAKINVLVVYLRVKRCVKLLHGEHSLHHDLAPSHWI